VAATFGCGCPWACCRTLWLGRQLERVDGGMDVVESDRDRVAAGRRATLLLFRLAFQRGERGLNHSWFSVEVTREDCHAGDDLVPLISHERTQDSI
jgi:hypothetical protein